MLAMRWAVLRAARLGEEMVREKRRGEWGAGAEVLWVTG